MKIRSSLLIIILSLLATVCQAQDLNSKILMTVNGIQTEAGEFIRMYKKSIEPGTKLDIDNYLQQFIVFKLKVADAVQEGYDTTNSFRNELTGYRNQLAQNYLTDSQAKEKLLQKAYQRSLTDINVWHILISLPQEPTPEDTLKAWKKASDIRERIIKGESFERVARGTSDDKSVKINGGNLGYFTAFQMIMPFEDAAYSLQVGKISFPVRTPYGYHIIKVTERRPSKGRIKVAHIMKNAPPGTGEKEASLAEEQINNIYMKLQEGRSFSDLAKKYSDHKESADKGGELNWFGTGEITSDFLEAAFKLADTGDYTKPVRTIYGWHIIKLLNRQAPGTYEETRSYLESKINQSSINSLSKKSLVEKLKKEYNFRINETAYNWFVENTDTLIIQRMKQYDRSMMPATNMYSFANQRLKAYEFANYIEKRGSLIKTADSVIFINNLLETKASEHIISYENSVLEKKYPEFRYLMNEFHDGILLFDISGKKVWDRVSNDTLGLQTFYEENKKNFLSKRHMEAKIYTLQLADGEKILSKAYKKFSGKPGTDDKLLEKFNKKTDTVLTITNNLWTEGDDRDIDKIEWKTGKQSFYMHGLPSLIIINKVIDPEPMQFEEVKGDMIKGYQEYLESNWTEQLKEKYIVKIDSLTLVEVKKKLSNE